MADETFTTQNAGGVTSNSPTADLTDSDANLTNGEVTFTTTATGKNLPSTSATSALADNPGIDAGIVRYNLTLGKKLESTPPFYAGSTITFTLTPHNDGPVAALAGWSVTEVLPADLTLDSMSGTGYDCATTKGTCVASAALAAGANGNPITVTVKVGAGFTGSTKNVAYVKPASTDGVETNPLVIPTATTDTVKSATDNDAEAAVPVASLVSIGDFVWLDNNRDGLQTSGEPGVAGVVVTLKDAQGATVATYTTLADGYYWFKDLTPGAAYTLTFTKPSGYTWTTQNVANGDDALDSDVNPADGTISFTAPASGTNGTGAPDKTDNPTYDGGLVQYNLTLTKTTDAAAKVRPGDTVTFTLTPSNAGPSAALAGWSIKDVLPAGLTATAITGSTAAYTCTLSTLSCVNNLPFPAGADLGFVTVTATVNAFSAGTTLTNLAYVAPVAGDGVETNPLGTAPTTPTDASKTPTDNDGSVVITLVPYVSVGDFVWYDVNRNGLQDAGEKPYASMTVQLFQGTDTTGTPLQTTTTNAAGYYSFVNLDPSTQYTVIFKKQADETFTTQNAGGVTSNSPTADLTDSDANVSTGEVTFTTTATGNNQPSTSATSALADNPGVDAGIVRYNLTLTKVLKTAGPYVPGMTVTYELTPHNDGPVAALTGWSVTDVLPAELTLVSMTGSGYDCTTTTGTCVAAAQLAANADGAVITVKATVGASFTGTAKNVAYVSPAATDGVETNPLVKPTVATDTATSATDNDAQASLTVQKVSIGDYVWWDHNRDGQQTPGEPVVAGATVELWLNGSKVATTTTDSAGFYAFTDLLPSTAYVVTFVNPDAQASFTTRYTGATSTDSNADRVDGTAPVTTKATGNNLADPGKTDDPTIDAGLVKYNLTLQKELIGDSNVRPGSMVSFKLTAQNAGPSTALPGWSITDVLPMGLTAIDISGSTSAYTCTLATVTCVNDQPFAAGADMGYVVVTAMMSNFSSTAVLTNLAYVAPVAGDLVPETNPLGTVPTYPVAHDTTPTDNDWSVPVYLTPYVSVGDYVWYDLNRDGLQTEGEQPYAGMTVELYRGTDTSVAPLGTTQTDSNGYYSFTNLDPQTQYTIKVVKKADESFTTQNVAGDSSNDPSDDVTDSDVDPSTGLVTFTTTQFGDNRPTILGNSLADNPGLDAGIVRYNLSLTKTLVTAGPYVPKQKVTYTLLPHNDGPVAALAGWSVTDVLPAGLTLVSMTGTGYDCSTKPGTCVAAAALAAKADGSVITVVATIDATFTGVAKNVAYVAPAATDGVETNPLVKPTLSTDTATSTTDNDAQASLEVTKVSIGDYVWLDNNRNGQQDTGEPAVPGMTVELWLNSAKVTSTTTDATGYYAFTDLLPGTDYVVRFVKPNATTSFTDQLTGPVTTDSNANPADGTAPVTTKPTGTNLADPGKADDPTIDAGLVTYNLTLTKKLVTAGPYIPGTSQVTFTLTPSNDGPSTALAGWSVTDLLPQGLTLVSMAGGATYECAANVCTSLVELKPGTAPVITVVASIDATFTGTLQNLAYVSPSGNDVPEVTPLIVPTPGKDTSKTDTDNDAEAWLIVPKVSIGDYVWWDANRDGQQSEGELSVPGVTVELWRGGTKVTSTTTSADGYYSFTNLLPGTDYVVRFVAPDGTVFTKALTGATVTDSSAKVTDGTAAVTTPVDGKNLGTARAADDPTIDAGLVQTNLVLTKKLVPGGPYYAGSTVTFTLTPSNTGHTDALAGWSVTEVLPTGLTLVSMTGEGYDCTTTPGTCVASLGLAAGQTGAVITVTATVGVGVSGALTNVAYVAPGKDDRAPESNPLVVPTSSTKTTETPTDNDAEASLTVSVPALPNTGSAVEPGWLVVAATALLAGVSLVGVGVRRRRSPARAW